MKKLLVFLVVIIQNYFASSQSIPDAVLTTLDGKKFDAARLNAKDNKLKVLFLWATWCVPCINELTTVNDLKENWRKQVDFELYAIAEDDNRSYNKVAPTVNGRGWQFIVLADKNQELKRKLGVSDIPFTLIVKNGQIIYRHVGYSDGDEEEIFNILKANQ